MGDNMCTEVICENWIMILMVQKWTVVSFNCFPLADTADIIGSYEFHNNSTKGVKH